MPPPWVADVAVDQFAEDAAELLLPPAAEDELLPAAGAELLEELELLQPAASKTEPTATKVVTIVFDARKVNPPMPAPGGCTRGKRWHLG
jgi:hypothetical protein